MIGAQTRVYEGMIVGEHTRDNDLEVNVVKGKKLTNVRASGKDENVLLTTPMKLTLEKAMSYITDDELVEVTPKSIRLRKRWLDPNERKRMERRDANVTVRRENFPWCDAKFVVIALPSSVAHSLERGVPDEQARICRRRAWRFSAPLLLPIRSPPTTRPERSSRRFPIGAATGGTFEKETEASSVFEADDVQVQGRQPVRRQARRQLQGYLDHARLTPTPSRNRIFSAGRSASAGANRFSARAILLSTFPSTARRSGEQQVSPIARNDRRARRCRGRPASRRRPSS